MKNLQNMNTREFFAAMTTISAPLGRILSDEEFENACKNVNAAKKENVPFVRFLAELAPWAVSFLLEKHAEDTFTIIGAFTGKTAEEILSQPATVTISELKTLFEGAD